MEFSYNITGRVWLFDDDVDTDQILPGHAMAEPVNKLKDYALSGSKYPDFAEKVNEDDIIIAGNNFGSGSSREQAAVALKTAGVGMVIAKSIARIFRRNAINIGLPVIEADLKSEFDHGDRVHIDLDEFVIENLENGNHYSLPEPGENTMETLKAGGLIEKVKKQINN
ncbi:MAG: 3-isopropylmalate dehydratase [Bacillota bacterium]